MKTTMLSKAAVARKRLRRKGELQVLSTRTVADLRAAGLSRARSTAVKPGLKLDAMRAKAAVARALVRKG